MSFHFLPLGRKIFPYCSLCLMASKQMSVALSPHPREQIMSLTPWKKCLIAFPGYVDIGIIPVGAREIRIEEVAEAGNFLALRSEDPEKYFLNGGWTIQWNGDYRVAGTTFTYERTGNWENLTSPGPTVEPVWIQVCSGFWAVGVCI